jgi:hypothetical protein
MSQGHVEGYVFPVYGDARYVRLSVAAAVSIRRHDARRPIALICEAAHRDLLVDREIRVFDEVRLIDPDHRSIVGFKHNTHRYAIFDRNLFLDTDMLMCRQPDPLWQSLASHPFTITGSLKADHFFGAPKGVMVVRDLLLGRRARTLKRFDLTYLPRVQSGMIYMRDVEAAREVNVRAAAYLSRQEETHFQSRMLESGRTLESCEWSLAMAMSALQVPVYPWLSGHDSPQLDFVADLTEHDADFTRVRCRLYSDDFTYSLRGLKNQALRRLALRILSIVPGKTDHLHVTPFFLHFGWFHHKRPILDLADRTWSSFTSGG